MIQNKMDKETNKEKKRILFFSGNLNLNFSKFHCIVYHS
jgi:hypothetical protein